MRNTLVILFFILFFCKTVNATQSNEDYLNSYIDSYDFNTAEGIINNNSSINNYSIKNIISDVVSGNISFSISGIFDLFFKIIFGELIAHKNIIRNIIFIAICSAFLKALTENFKFNSVGKLGSYVMYILVITFLVTSFDLIYTYTIDLITNLSNFIISSIPLMIGTLFLSGNPNTALISQPIFLSLSYILIYGVKNVLLPFIYLIFLAEIFNNLSDKQILKGFVQSSKKVITYSIKYTMYIFLFIVSFFRIASPVSDGLIKKGFQTSMSFIPIIGNTLSSAVGTVYYFGDAIKSGLSLALIIGVIILSFVIVLRIFAVQIVYHYVSIVVEPICDKKIINAFNCLKNHIGYILAIITSSLFMFIVSTMLILTI